MKTLVCDELCGVTSLHEQERKRQWERALVSEFCGAGKNSKLNRKQVFLTTCTFAALDTSVSKHSLFNWCTSRAIARRRDTQVTVCIFAEKLGARILYSHLYCILLGHAAHVQSNDVMQIQTVRCGWRKICSQSRNLCMGGRKGRFLSNWDPRTWAAGARWCFVMLLSMKFLLQSSFHWLQW